MFLWRNKKLSGYLEPWLQTKYITVTIIKISDHNMQERKKYTPQPLHNTIAGIRSKNHVS